MALKRRRSSRSIEERRVAFAPDNPFRTPSWRWECARFRAENGWTVPPRTEGRWIRRAFRFHQVLLKYHREEAFDRLLKWRPELVFAYELWANTQSMARDIVEACILSGQTTDQIARKLCFHWEGIDAYAELFYDVRHKLRHRGYVNAVLIGPEHSGPLARVTFPTVLKSFAYHMGPCFGRSARRLQLERGASRGRGHSRRPSPDGALRIDCQGGGRRKADPS
jgi:hypothetical protein